MAIFDSAVFDSGVFDVDANPSVTIGTGITIRRDRITLQRNDDYLTVDDRHLVFPMRSDENWPNLTGAAISLYITITGTGITHAVDGEVITPTGDDRTVYAEFDDTVTATAGYGQFNLMATLTSGNIARLRHGLVMIRP